LAIDVDGYSTLYIPSSLSDRSLWSSEAVQKNNDWIEALDIDSIEYTGTPIKSYSFSPLWSSESMIAVIDVINSVISSRGSIFTLAQEFGNHNIYARLALSRMSHFIPDFSDSVVDISYVDVTLKAQDVARLAIQHGATELDVRAALEAEIVASGSAIAFESIVASGKNSTVLHHHPSLKKICASELVVVDIGARVNGYCADISRTFVVDSFMSVRQQYIFDVVSECQRYIASQAKPGIFLRNAKEQDQSLHHMAVRFFAEHNLESYFPHSIGHYLGLDVHDVGDYNSPLREGDVITIEPGIYISDEYLGIRVEDDFYVLSNGVIPLSGTNLSKMI
jgi:Xaa-Pro aminopeptidase